MINTQEQQANSIWDELSEESKVEILQQYGLMINEEDLSDTMVNMFGEGGAEELREETKELTEK